MNGIYSITSLALRLGKEVRATKHADGTPESVATHTLSLALVLLDRFLQDPSAYETLDLQKVLSYALVHDLPEALVGDVSTLLPLSEAELAEKEGNEEKARRAIGVLHPGLAGLVESYERQDTPEARLVKLWDKTMPKLVYAGGDLPCTYEQLRDSQNRQAAKLRAYRYEFPGDYGIYLQASRSVLERVPGSKLDTSVTAREYVLEPGSDLRGATLHGLDLDGVDLEGSNLEGADFSGSSLRGAMLGGSRIGGTDFSSANLRGAEMAKASGENTNFVGADLDNVNLCYARLESAILVGAKIRGANLSRAKMPKADFTDAKACWSDFTDSEIEDADLTGADFTGVDFRWAKTCGADFSGADITRVLGLFEDNAQVPE